MQQVTLETIVTIPAGLSYGYSEPFSIAGYTADTFYTKRIGVTGTAASLMKATSLQINGAAPPVTNEDVWFQTGQAQAVDTNDVWVRATFDNYNLCDKYARMYIVVSEVQTEDRQVKYIVTLRG